MAKKTGKTNPNTDAPAEATAVKTPRPQKAKKEKKSVLTKVVSFRVSDERHKTIADSLEKSPVIGCNSVSDFARKLFADYLAGRLSYRNKKHLEADYDKL